MKDPYKAIREMRRFERLFPEFFHRMELVGVDCKLSSRQEAVCDLDKAEALLSKCIDAIQRVGAEI